MKRINLLPKPAQQEVRLLFFGKQLLLFWIWALITLLIFLILTFIAKSYLVRELADVSGQVDSEKLVLKSSDNERLKQEVGNLNDQIKTINNLSSQHYYWSGALTELGRLLAPDIRLDLVSMERATGKVQIQGIAGNRDSVLRFWSDVHKSSYFKNIDFPLSNLNRATNDTFTFTFYVNADQLKKP